MEDEKTLVAQARLFTKYLIGRQPSDKVVARYQDALQYAPHTPSDKDAKRLRFVLKHGWTLGFIDAGLVLSEPYSELRRRLYVMLAILESSPEYTEYFLPQQRSLWYLFKIGYTGFVGGLKAVVGLVFVKVMR